MICVQNTILLVDLREKIKMRMGKVRFLEKGEQIALPKWMGRLPKGWQKKYVEKGKPYVWEGDTAILQTTAENSMTPVWRKNAEKLLEEMKHQEIAIIIPPLEGELPTDILPFADGRRLTTLFAFIGAAEALKRQGKNPAQCRYLLVGGNEKIWRMALVSMGAEVNHLAILTENVKEAEKLGQVLFEECGLMTQVFASPQNDTFGQADMVFCCGMEQRKYERALKEGAIWIDLVANRPVLKRLRESRPDVISCDGFFFGQGKGRKEGRRAEAEAFLSCRLFRESWRFFADDIAGKKIVYELQEQGYAVSGFSRGGNRVKIQKS